MNFKCFFIFDEGYPWKNNQTKKPKKITQKNNVASCILAYGIRMQRNPKTKAEIFWSFIYYWMYVTDSQTGWAIHVDDWNGCDKIQG